MTPPSHSSVPVVCSSLRAKRKTWNFGFVYRRLVGVGVLVRAARARARLNSVHARAGGVAIDAQTRTPTVTASSGDEFEVVMWQRSAGGEETLLLRGCADNGSDSRVFRLRRRQVGTCWSDDEHGLRLTMTDSDLFARLLQARTGCPKAAACAPAWSPSVTSALERWPLKGAGAVVFDIACFLEHGASLVREGRGPVLFPGGAFQLDLPTAALAFNLKANVAGGREASLVQVFAGQEKSHVTYSELLHACPEIGTGIVDLSGVEASSEHHHPAQDMATRTITLTSRPFGLEYVPRSWSQGATVRAVCPGSVAEQAGCRAGDVIVSVAGRNLLTAPLGVVDSYMLDSPLPVTLELQQPVLHDRFYVREASVSLLRELCGDDTVASAGMLLPRLQEMFCGRLIPTERAPTVFAGDGGSASHVHVDRDPLIQMCHMLHGTKLFGVSSRTDAGSSDLAWISKIGKTAGEEVSLRPDTRPRPELEAWLESDEVSLALCCAGDILLFWGGHPHFGSNGMASGPSIALFHGCRAAEPK